MTKATARTPLMLALAPALASGACVMPGQKPVDKSALAATECGPEGLIDDMEDNNNQGSVVEGRGGYWYTYVDETGSTVDPPAGAQGGQFFMTEGGANGSKFAARVKGNLSGAAINFGAMGVNLVDPKDTYDASKYAGISFWAKRSGGTTAKVRVKFPDINTDEEGGNCKECFNDFGMDLNLSESWQKYVVLFGKAKQEVGWGSPRPRKISANGLYAVQFQARGAGEYDVWVDDIKFVGCGDEE